MDGALERSSDTSGGTCMADLGQPGVSSARLFPRSPWRLFADVKESNYLIEFLAVFVAIRLWGRACRNNFVVSFVGNEASRAALIKAWLDSVPANSILRLYVDDEMEHGWKPWFGN